MEDLSLMCGARGCPNRWSVDGGNGRLCSRHAWSQPKDWPSITESINRSPVEAIPQSRQISDEEKLSILRKLEQIGASDDPKRWAKALKEREARGDRLSSFQRSAWREAIGERND